MEERFEHNPNEVKQMNTSQIREAFAVTELMRRGEINFVYSHYDRMIIGGAVPTETEIKLTSYPALKSDFFLERREMGIINIGGDGRVTADGNDYHLSRLDCLYLAKGTEEVSFKSDDPAKPAFFYLLSTPAHHAHENRLMKMEEAVTESLGDTENK